LFPAAVEFVDDLDFAAHTPAQILECGDMDDGRQHAM
jgi:hypothetical protein